uniref:Serine/threonine-protein phosphatase 2A activator n=1 Tax=Picea sitchensis TaxID=3332 RepID=A9NUR1_PICSI|nr:unknown [Picea sitchensis]
MADSEINYTAMPQAGIKTEESPTKERQATEEIAEKTASTPEKSAAQNHREEGNPMEENPAAEGSTFQSPPPPPPPAPAAACGRCPCGEAASFPNGGGFGLSPPPVPTNYRPIRAPALLTPPNTQAVILAPVPQAQKVPLVSAPFSFQIPRRRISSPADIEHFHNSDSGRAFLGFVVALSESIRGHKISDECFESPAVKAIVEILGIMDGWIDEIPPLQQPARYGNPAFRQWQERLQQGQELMDRVLTQDLHASIPEIYPYFGDSFGNAMRIDYGTGHEANFAAWLFCLARLGVLTENDYQAVVSRVFVKYLGLMRRLQTTYWLEPAGSHGVWGLDDYHFLPFVFGSSQLVDHKYMKPKSIHNQDILDNFSDEYLYLSCVAFVKKVKKGHLAEHSPMIDDISAVPNWGKVNSGMLKMYKAEVLEKVPIMQHFLFGSLLNGSEPLDLSI